jgi:hypothetical protein
MYSNGLIAPVVVLIIWSLLMLIWLYATRIPAMQAAKIDPEKFKDDPNAGAKLPVGARRVADNYNHLMEQPTLFYAICFALHLLGRGDDTLLIGWAWAYVALRALHSLVQATVNVIMIRFTIFMASSVALGVLAYHAAMALDIVHWF